MYVNYRVDDEFRLGYLDGERLIRLGDGSTDDLVRAEFPEPTGPVEDRPFTLAPALLRPGKILCLLRSYRAHAEEFGHEPPADPTFFAKLPSALAAHGGAIRIPGWLEGEVHYEGELALVVGRRGKEIPPERALEHVAAYTVANDVTARTLQKADAARGWPWVRAKSLDTFLPLGPGLVPASGVPDPDSLSLEVRVNGDVKQHGNTARLLWPIAAIVSCLSRFVTLDAGDLVLTGTPEGVGPLAPGDRVEVEVFGVGRLENSVERD